MAVTAAPRVVAEVEVEGVAAEVLHDMAAAVLTV